MALGDLTETLSKILESRYAGQIKENDAGLEDGAYLILRLVLDREIHHENGLLGVIPPLTNYPMIEPSLIPLAELALPNP